LSSTVQNAANCDGVQIENQLYNVGLCQKKKKRKKAENTLSRVSAGPKLEAELNLQISVKKMKIVMCCNTNPTPP